MYNIRIKEENLLSEFYIAQHTYTHHDRNLQGIKYTDEKETFKVLNIQMERRNESVLLDTV